MSQESLAVLAVAAVLLLAGLANAVRRRGGPPSMPVDDVLEPVHRAGPLERLRDVVDRSVGLYLVRRLPGRPTDRMHRQPLPALSAEEVAFRIGVPDARHEPHARPMVLTQVAPTVAAPVRAFSRSPAGATIEPRWRLIRDTSAALAGLAAVALIAVAVWPPTPDGRVLSVTATPGPSGAAIALTEAPSGAPTSPPAASPSPGPTSPESSVTPVTPSDVPSEAPRPDASATGGSVTVRPYIPHGPRPTASPRATPTPTPRVGPTPTVAPLPTPAPSPSPSPSSTPTPTPPPGSTPAPTPTPEPTPTSTPEPTPTPTPEPTPTPTPEPTP